jgi:hypothetical protein
MRSEIVKAVKMGSVLATARLKQSKHKTHSGNCRESEFDTQDAK